MYPSEDLKNWCTQIKNLWVNTSKTRHTELYGDFGWCECEAQAAILKAPTLKQKKLLASGLFWSVWIDQVIYTVTKKQNENLFLNENLYEQFREKYPFPKVYSHSSAGHTIPYIILGNNCDYTPDLSMLIEFKNDYWGEIENYFLDLGEWNLVYYAKLEFENDLAERGFPEKYYKLWEE